VQRLPKRGLGAILKHFTSLLFMLNYTFYLSFYVAVMNNFQVQVQDYLQVLIFSKSEEKYA